MFLPVKSLQIHLVLLTTYLLKVCLAMDYDLTVEIQPGERECFHQFIEKTSQFEIEYQVIEGGELDINFFVQSPTSKVLLTEIRKSDGVHTIQATEEGDYMFCMDNTFSRFSKKMVFFEIITDGSDKDWDDLKGWEDYEYDENTYEVKIDDMKSYLDRVKERLDKSQQTQNILRVYESRDRSIQESNFERVNTCSVIILVIMLITGIVQVMLIRNLFEDRSKVGKILKIRT